MKNCFKITYREYIGKKSRLAYAIINGVAMAHHAKDKFCQQYDRHHSVILKVEKL